MTAVSEPPPRVNLAHEPDFRLGGLVVQPSACRIVAADGEQRLEPRVMEVLVVLARAGGRTVTRDELIEACWEGRFVSEDAITRIIAKVRNLVRSTDPPPFVLETVPKVGFRLTAPEGDPDQASDVAKPSADPAWRIRRMLPVAAILALLLATIAGWALWRARSGPESPPAWQNGRVEVMLFEPLRPEPELQRFAVALGDAVVRTLGRSGLETVQRPLPRDAGSPGAAEFRIAGTVDRDGDRYVVNGQILHTRSGLVLWSGRIDRPAAAAEGFAEEAAFNTASFLKCALDHRKAYGRAMAPSVLGLLLNACAAAVAGNSPAQGLEATRRLTDAAPRFAGAHALHGMAASWLAGRTDSPAEVERLRAQARASAKRALELNPREAWAHVALGTSYGGGGHWATRERHFLRALELSPDILPHVGWTRVYLLREVGRAREAQEVGARALTQDPGAEWGLAPMALITAAAGDLPQARQFVDRLALISPPSARKLEWTIAFWWDDPQVARPRVRELAAGVEPSWAADCFDRHLQMLADARAAGAKGLPQQCERMSSDWRIRMLARQGDLDGAYAEFAKPIPNSQQHTMLLFYPEMKAFRRDPRFMPLAKRLGLVDYWLETDRWPDFCSEPDVPYDCRAAANAVAPGPTR